MTRRDEIIERLGDLNSKAVLEKKMLDLEIFIDNELKKDETLIRFINSGTSGSIFEDGLEVINNFDQLKVSNDVHRDINVTHETPSEQIKVSIGSGSTAVSYTIWSDDNLLLNDNDATETPWFDRVIAEGTFDGELSIQCPENTNKNVAIMLANKMNRVDEFDSDNNPTVGNWSKAIQPNDISNEKPIYPEVSDAVSVRYNTANNLVFMVFKLY